MPRAKCAFRQSDVTRVLRAAKAAGFEAVRITVKQDGVEIDERLANASDAEHENPWDGVLSNAEDKKRSA